MTKKNLNCVLMVKRIWHSEIEVIHGGKQKGEDEKMITVHNVYDANSIGEC